MPKQPKIIADAQAASNRQAGINNALRIGLLMAGVGAAGRGVQGLLSLGNQNLGGHARSPSRYRSLNVPIRYDDEEEKKRFKFSNDGNFATNLIKDTITQPISDAFTGHTSNPNSWAFALPAAVAAGGAGMVGGYKLTDYLLDRRRKGQLDSELEQAKQDYEDALAGKSAAGRDLDKLYDAMHEKLATTAADAWGTGIGGALALGIPLSLISGLITYDLTKKRTPSEVLRKAKLKRNRELSQRQPPAIYARPQYSQPMSADVPSSDELAGEPLDKAALAPSLRS